jgi:hypothetical protein
LRSPTANDAKPATSPYESIGSDWLKRSLAEIYGNLPVFTCRRPPIIFLQLSHLGEGNLVQSRAAQFPRYSSSSCPSFGTSLPAFHLILIHCQLQRGGSVCDKISSQFGHLYTTPTMSADALKAVPFPLPTLDRPFGVELWPFFEKVWTQFRSFPPQDFRFVPGTTPMSTLKETTAVLVSYYIIVLGGRELMKNRPAIKLNPIFKVHNLGLTIISASLLVLFIEQLLPTVVRQGVFFAICNADGGWTKPLVTLYYVRCLQKSTMTTTLMLYS